MITGPLSDDLANFTGFGCTYKIEKSLKNAKKHGIVLAAMNHFIKTPLIVHFPMTVDKYSEEFRQNVLSSEFLNKKNAKESRNAYVDSFETEFPYSTGDTRHEA